jgi:hypothetical protein
VVFLWVPRNECRCRNFFLDERAHPLVFISGAYQDINTARFLNFVKFIVELLAQRVDPALLDFFRLRLSI